MRKIISRHAMPFVFGLTLLGCGVITPGGINWGKGIEIIGETGAKIIIAECKNVDDVNISQEYYVGRGVAASVFKKYKRYKDPSLDEYVRMVGLNVGMGAKMEGLKTPYKGYFFAILDDESVNAFSAPGGFVFITLGAVKKMANEDELACVLGHEIGHISDRHGMKQTIEKKRFSIPLQEITKETAARSPAVISKLAEQMGGMVGDLADGAFNGFGVKYELRADELGTIFAAKAGYDPKAMAEFVKRTRQGEDRS